MKLASKNELHTVEESSERNTRKKTWEKNPDRKE